jgi:ERCC4-type nuclease
MESRYQIVIDSRERALIATLEGHGVPVCVQSLDVGDVVFRDATSGEYVFCVERKRVDDCVASVRDGRYEDQKARMLAAFGCDRMLYVLEGHTSDLPDTTSRRTCAGMLYNTLIRDGIAVVQSSGIDETELHVQQLWHRMPMILNFTRRHGAPASDSDSATRPSCVSLSSFRKSYGVTRDDVFAAQLAMVPGISIATARHLADHVSGFGDLRARLDDGSLEHVKINGRRIGNKIKALRDHLCF